MKSTLPSCVAQLLLVQLALSFRLVPKETGCSFFIPDLDPEVIVASVDTYEFLYPQPDEDSVFLQEGESVLISCPGGLLTAGSSQGATTVEATCESGSTFNVNGESVNFRNIKCSRNPFHTARYTQDSCEDGGKEIEVGFILSETQFVRQLRICFDEKNLNTLYSEYMITKSIGHHESGISRPSFIQDDFYSIGTSVNDLYVRDGQRETINKLLGLSSGSTKYIQDNDYFLSRGHLAAKADFVYGTQQTATFHYVNAAPQWQTVNGGNWNTAEGDVRNYADNNNVDLLVIAGTYGVATLPHEETGESIELYLYVDGDQTGIRIPMLYWKLVYNPETQEAVALLSLNNPYQEDINNSVICKDISSNISWLKWNRDNIELGYSYACTYDSLKEKISYVPNLDVQGVLL